MDFGLAEAGQRLPDTEAVLTHAADIKDTGAQADDVMDTVGHIWGLLTTPGVYSVPGDETVFTAMERPRISVEELSNYTIQLDAVMRSYAETVQWLRIQYETMQTRAAGFSTEFPDSEVDEWDDDQDAVQSRNSIARDVAKLLSDLDEAQREAANRIANITGSGRSYAEHDLNMRDGFLPYGFDDSEYLAETGGKMDRDLPWYQDTFNFTRDTLIGIPAAGWEFVEDLGVFVGFQGADKRSDAWKSLYRLSENFLIFTGKVPVDEQRRTSALAQLTLVGFDLIRMDQWNSDRPGLALGGNIFDAGSILVGGGLLTAPGKAAAKTATRGAVKGARKVIEKARSGLDNLNTGSPGNHGLVPAIPNGRIPLQPQTPASPEGIWFKDGKARIPFLSGYGPFATNPSEQPQPGDTGGGNGYYRDEPRTQHGAPEQQYVTGVDRVDDGHAREYVMEQPGGKEVSFDGHQWRWDYRSDPPKYKEYFTEVKGYYSWMWPAKLQEEFDGWINGELSRQKIALDHSAGEGYVHEIVFTEKSVMDAFDEYLPPGSPLRENLILRFEEVPDYPTPPSRKG